MAPSTKQGFRNLRYSASLPRISPSHLVIPCDLLATAPVALQLGVKVIFVLLWSLLSYGQLLVRGFTGVLGGGREG